MDQLDTVNRISKDLRLLKKLNIQICIVIGGGNIFRGLATAKGMDELTQIIYASHYCE